MMKKIFFLVLWAAAYLAVPAQQEPQLTQYMFNKTVINPATVGTSGAICFTGITRIQWIGFQDFEGQTVNPKTYAFTFDMPVYSISSGAGLMARYYTLGAEKNLDIRLQYAYHHEFKKKSVLSAGISLAFLNKSVDYSRLQQHEFDPLLPSVANESGLITDLSIGFYYRVPEKFRLGFSASNLLGSSAEIGGPDITNSRHYYLHGAYDFSFHAGEKRQLILTPGFLVKNTNGSTQADLSAILSLDRMVWLGLIYRVEQAVGVIAGINYKGFSAGIAYDFTLSSYHTKEYKGSFEVFLRYCLPIEPKIPQRSGYNTRNL